MNHRRLSLVQRLGALAIACWSASVVAAAAQANVGTGPLTGTLPESEPLAGTVSLGPVRLAPGLTIRELGWDSNIFGEPENPREDYVASLVPDTSAFARLRYFKLAGYAGGDLRYYKNYQRERSTGYLLQGRADILLSRLRPFVAGGRTKMRTRPNAEIDVRADRQETEVSGGVAFDVSRYGQVYAAASRFTTEFEDAFEDNVALGPALNRDSYQYSGGVRTELTPLTALTLSGSYGEDQFHIEPRRNATSRSADATLRFSADAIITGFASVAFRDFTPVDSFVRGYRGLVWRVGLVYPLLEVGRFSFLANRGNEYSFDITEGYYLENTFALGYTHRLFGHVDASVTGSKSIFDYGFTAASPAREDKLDSVLGGVGYNLPNRTRISVNYEYSRRRSPQLAERNYDRRRVFLAWNVAF